MAGSTKLRPFLLTLLLLLSTTIGACVDLLGGLVHVGIGDPVVNKCCPLLEGLVELEAAVCLCTTIRLKLLNINIYLPLALQLLLTCGKNPPPGYTCSI
uniref:Bifunctional inhibitor/plant lipid transfer protein/seed storage helical domain-containing protein n=1 Tax=Oryza barthii TaxID=65489 RepID=A0A0D3GJ63_9ORYZ